MVTTLFYHTMKSVADGKLFKRMVKNIGCATHFERKGAFLVLQKIVDKS